jgi:hypothetical protein
MKPAEVADLLGIDGKELRVLRSTAQSINLNGVVDQDIGGANS